MTTKTNLAQALTLTETDAGSTRAVPRASGDLSALIPPEWSQGRATYGGLVGALLARAVERKIPNDRQLRSALVDFIAPVAPGEAVLETSVLRAGRSLTHAEARLLQNGEVAAVFMGVYATRRSTSLHLPALEAPATLPIDQLFRLPYIEGLMPRFTQHFQYHVVADRELFTGRAEAKVGGYLRHPEPGPVDAAGILALTDAWPPAFMPTLTKLSVASSVTWMVDIVADLPPSGTASDAFYRYEAEAVAAAGGYASCEARLWGPDGKLVATSRQLVAEFS